MTTALGDAAFWILTTLVDGRRHGYAVVRAVAEASDGRVTLKATTLYATLERLEAAGLVAADGDEIVDGRARRYFRLTDEGRTRLEAEVAQLEARARAARQALGAPRIARTAAATA